MDLSLIVISRNEAPRLRLCLASIEAAVSAMALSGKTHSGKTLARMKAEVIVVDDASSDSTAEVIAEFAARGVVTRGIRCEACVGRSAARNAGARLATAEIVMFLDGDVLLHPEAIRRHLERHLERQSGEGPLLVRGETHHLRQFRALYDPERGIGFGGEEAGDDAVRLTVGDVSARIEHVHALSSPGIYPGAIPRISYERERAALTSDSPPTSLWAAVSSHNISMPRADFEAVGGFWEALSLNEHRELALRLQDRGISIVLAEGAFSYHLCHRSGWLDPLTRLEAWEPCFLERHPRNDVRLLKFFWMSLSDRSSLPRELRIESLHELSRRAKEDLSAYEAYRSSDER